MKELRYTIGQVATIKEDSDLANAIENIGGKKVEIVGFDDEEEFDYQILVMGENTPPLFANDEELE